MSSFPLSYDFNRSWKWNLEHGPKQLRGKLQIPKTSRSTQFLGFKLNSPLGIAAGPLLNGRWVLYYSRLGFDILTYKTVRSSEWPSNPLPNVTYVKVKDNIGEKVSRSRSITNSFGMPSMPPSFWVKDVARTKKRLAPGQILIVSVVGTPRNGNLVDDFVQVTKLAAESKADAVEVNLSCPNVRGEGLLCHDFASSREIIRKTSKARGKKPMLVKLSALPKKQLERLLEEIERYADGVVSINSVSMKIEKQGKPFLVGGQKSSGVCGEGVKDIAEKELKKIVSWKKKNKAKMAVVTIGGVMTVEDVKTRLRVGADAVTVATAAILNPGLAIDFKKT